MKKLKALIKEEKGEGHKAKNFKEFVKEEKAESYHKGTPKSKIVKEEFGSDARAKKVEGMLTRKTRKDKYLPKV